MKLGISGPQSVGKSTLLNCLKDDVYFKYFSFRDEVTRTVAKTGLHINMTGNNETQIAIMKEHVCNIFLYPRMITDRTSLDGYVYSLWLHINGNITDETLQYAKMVFDQTIDHYDVIFYIRPEFDIVEDGVRSASISFRDEIAMIFEEVIVRECLNVHTLTGTVAERMTQIRNVLYGEFIDKDN